MEALPCADVHLTSLAAGTVPELAPADAVDAAASAGFPAAGIWVDLTAWTPAVTAAVVHRLDATGLVALDAEPIYLVLDRTVGQYAELCAHGVALGVHPVFEFMRFMTVRTLPDALDVVRRAGHPDG